MFVDRWYQTESVDAIGPYYTAEDKGERHPLIGLPTGTGKSLVIARSVQRIFDYFPWHRGLVLTHVKELVEQNAKKLSQVWPTAPMGICSAGLKRYDIAQPIIYGGVGTVVGRVDEMGHRDFLFIDEAQLVGPNEESEYGKVIKSLRSVNPKLTVIGLSATLYRMRMGALTEGGLFTDIAYDLTDMDGFNRLLSEGYLAPLVPQPTNTKLDTSGVAKARGDFVQGALERAVDKDDTNKRLAVEMAEMAWDRNCWIVFASGISHAEHLAQELNAIGISAAAVHSKKKDSDKIIEAFRRGKIRCLVNFNKLTTGFDHPPIDFIGMCRPTTSVILWVQMLGRGTRPYDGRYANQYIRGFEYIKIDCLVADFGRNVERLGPINDPVLPRAPGQKTGDVPIKICPKCNTYNHASARQCCNPRCNHEFPFGGAQLMQTASHNQLIRAAEMPQVEYLDVKHVIYSRIDKNGVPPMMKVSYVCGIKSFNEIVCLEHATAAKHFARDWWRQRYNGEPPETTDQGLMMAHAGILPTPKRIKVWVNKKPYPEVMGHEF